MRVKSRLTPYPVLNNYRDDYLNSSYTADYNLNALNGKIEGSIDFHLNNDEIEKLIEDNKAEHVVHVECPTTSYRKILSTRDNSINIGISEADISKTVEVRTFIILKEDVQGFTSSNFHTDYDGVSFNLKKNSIIAEGTAKDFDLITDNHSLNNLPSIIKIETLNNKKKGNISVNTDSDEYITIGIEKNLYDSYYTLGGNMLKDTMFSLILLPAMIIILERMVKYKEDEDMNSKHWFKVINNKLEEAHYSLDRLSIENDTLLKTVQEMFAYPIERSFNELNDIIERGMNP